MSCIGCEKLPLTFILFSAKRSWFSNFRSERDKEEVVVVHRDKGFHDLKVSLIQALKVRPYCNNTI